MEFKMYIGARVNTVNVCYLIDVRLISMMMCNNYFFCFYK